MSVLLLPPSFLMSKTRSYSQILIGSWSFLKAMAIDLSLWVVPLDLQQGGNSCILYVHVLAAQICILFYIAKTIKTFFFPINKASSFSSLFQNKYKNRCFFFPCLLLLLGFRGRRPMWGTFWEWDAHLTSVFILFFIYMGAPHFQKLIGELASISICVRPIDIPIIKYLVNWWNTSHQLWRIR